MSDDYDLIPVTEYKTWNLLRHDAKNLYYIEKDGQRHGPFITLSDCRVYIDLVSGSSVGIENDVGRS